MKPIENKILAAIKKEDLSFEKVQQIIEETDPKELKKSFTDDCLFQSSRYFAKTSLNSLLNYKLIKFENGKYSMLKKANLPQE